MSKQAAALMDTAKEAEQASLDLLGCDLLDSDEARSALGRIIQAHATFADLRPEEVRDLYAACLATMPEILQDPAKC